MFNSLSEEKKLPNACIVINGIDMSKKKYGYAYGYGKYGKYGKDGRNSGMFTQDNSNGDFSVYFQNEEQKKEKQAEIEENNAKLSNENARRSKMQSLTSVITFLTSLMIPSIRFFIFT